MWGEVQVPGPADLGLAEATAPTACSAEDAAAAIGLVEEWSGEAVATMRTRAEGVALYTLSLSPRRRERGGGSEAGEAESTRRHDQLLLLLLLGDEVEGLGWSGGRLSVRGVYAPRRSGSRFYGGGDGHIRWRAHAASSAAHSGAREPGAGAEVRASVPSTTGRPPPAPLFWMDLIR